MVGKVKNKLISLLPIGEGDSEKTSFAPDKYLSHVLRAKKKFGQTKRSYNQSTSFHKFVPLQIRFFS